MESYEEPSEEKIKSSEKLLEEISGLKAEPVSCADLPENVLDHFESQSRKFIHPDDYVAGNFSKIYKIPKSASRVKYIAQQDKTYDTNGETERLSYLVDTSDGEITGYLEMRLGITDLDEYFKNKPFVGFTRTNEGFEREGLAYQRLIEANDYSISEHGYPLNSDSLMTDEAKGVWEKLEKEGKVDRYKQGKNVRFRFKLSK